MCGRSGADVTAIDKQFYVVAGHDGFSVGIPKFRIFNIQSASQCKLQDEMLACGWPQCHAGGERRPTLLHAVGRVRR